ncbi:aromatase/cyclase [Streptomyces silvisoli]|uniref:Aromatase/cyclase n=1 Tax=Streptomyces silvisoli TaxID=3034235 RepID=A0ABT5ZU60_9ACTN|nr:aromatase/cyclase [Streptomyces silvisoli]MDF3293367.1 aromatase/cyclase [Streptomyces silvisoli]
MSSIPVGGQHHTPTARGGQPELRRTEHLRYSMAPAQTLYELAADVTRWPAIFGPSVFAQHLGRGQGTERFRLWAQVNGEVKSWVSRRELDPDALWIRFDQEQSASPIASMGGEWHFRPLPDGGTEIVLLHEFTAVDDNPETASWITSALDRNSAVELEALTRIAELGRPLDELVFSFTDTVALKRSAAEVYDFLYRSDLWPQRLPHVQRVVLKEDEPNVQDMVMETVTADGSTHSTHSVRVCVPGQLIVYKQLVPPRLLFGHSGRWELAGAGDEVLVTAEHTVAINPAAVAEVLGAGKTLADAREYIRTALGRNSRSTLAHAGTFAHE